MLNKYVWKNYLRAGGNEVVELFRQNLSEQYTENYSVVVRKMLAQFCPLSKELDDVQEQLKDIIEEVGDADNAQDAEPIEPVIDYGKQEDSTKNDEIMMDVLCEEYNILEGFIKEAGMEPDAKSVFTIFSNNIAMRTTLLALSNPGLFFPYYFQYNYNILQSIADEFGIDLPAIPLKKDYEGRFLHYGHICHAMIDYMQDNDLTPYEMCAFLYDFAPNYIGGIESYIIDNLPEPKGAFFIGGSKDDAFYTNDPSAITIWQCNESTRAGDMILMYLRTPISAVDSLWRACSVGFIDPFFYYYRCTYIGCPQKIGPISRKALKADNITGELPIVKKNMQGINGVELLPTIYNHILDMASVEGYRFMETEIATTAYYQREKDVEDKLIKPLLLELGYSEEDYTQQLYIEIGNHNHALIPDFVLLPFRAVGHASAFAIIEAKRSISNQKMLEEAKAQARSYANLLNVKYSIVAAQEKVWITSKNDDYTDDILAGTWTEIYNADTFFELRKLIGKR